jgi:hypothetical protein
MQPNMIRAQFRKLLAASSLLLGLVIEAPSEALGQQVLSSPSVQIASGGVAKLPAQLTSNDGLRVSTRRIAMVQPPKSDPSASDLKSQDEDKSKDQDGIANEGSEKDTTFIDTDINQDTDGNGKPDGKKELVPVQLGLLDPNVTATNIATRSIGTGLLPENTALSRMPGSVPLPNGMSRGMIGQDVHWAPSNICYYPIYFEDAMLERHGHVRWGVAQPLVSGVRFITTITLLPYLTTLQPPCEPRYALGHFRPGSCAPALKDHLPWDRRAATVQLMSTATYFWAMPL